MGKIKFIFQSRFWSILLITLGLVLILGAIYNIPAVQNWRYIKAYKISLEAKKYPIGSNERNRLNTISDTIRKGEKNYTPSSNFNPITMPAN